MPFLDPKLRKVLQQVDRLLEEDRAVEVHTGCTIQVQKDRGVVYVFDESGRPVITVRGLRNPSLSEGQLDVSVDVGIHERPGNIVRCRVDYPQGPHHE